MSQDFKDIPARPFKLKKGYKDDPVIKKILEVDMKGLPTPLALFKKYTDVINNSSTYGGLEKKLDRLFAFGSAPSDLSGFYYGVTIGMRDGLSSGIGELSKIISWTGLGKKVDPMQIFFGRILSKTSPWAGKSFSRIEPLKLNDYTDGYEKGKTTTYLGINSFRREKDSAVNHVADYLLSHMMDMKDVPDPNKNVNSWINAKGGLFIATKRSSVNAATPDKKVLALNYRWKKLGNKFPNSLLVDEIVEVAKGLYLGKLYYSTALRYIDSKYNPKISEKKFKYRGFGYFLLMDDTWLHEKNVLFPDLAFNLEPDLSKKFSTLSGASNKGGKALQATVSKHKTVLHYLKYLSEQIKDGGSDEASAFKDVNKLFMNGLPPDGISGFLHGGVVGFKQAGLMRDLPGNTLNDMYSCLRVFSPWTGKTFAETDLKGVKKYIGNDAVYYKDKNPLYIGHNTYSRNPLSPSFAATVFIENLDKIGMYVEKGTKEEQDAGYVGIKSFSFIADMAPSVIPSCNGKVVLQFNYRWPKFHTMPPDCLCIDELVRIADGLYLGQLLYSTAPFKKYDPSKKPSVYKYENFGYFLVMDSEWFAIKELIGGLD
ncbi:MAG: hypothetical protein V3T30_04640 [Thermodesulfobacteriota bacterium]